MPTRGAVVRLTNSKRRKIRAEVRRICEPFTNGSLLRLMNSMSPTIQPALLSMLEETAAFLVHSRDGLSYHDTKVFALIAMCVLPLHQSLTDALRLASLRCLRHCAQTIAGREMMEMGAVRFALRALEECADPAVRQSAFGLLFDCLESDAVRDGLLHSAVARKLCLPHPLRPLDHRYQMKILMYAVCDEGFDTPLNPRLHECIVRATCGVIEQATHSTDPKALANAISVLKNVARSERLTQKRMRPASLELSRAAKQALTVFTPQVCMVLMRAFDRVCRASAPMRKEILGVLLRISSGYGAFSLVDADILAWIDHVDPVTRVDGGRSVDFICSNLIYEDAPRIAHRVAASPRFAESVTLAGYREALADDDRDALFWVFEALIFYGEHADSALIATYRNGDAALREFVAWAAMRNKDMPTRLAELHLAMRQNPALTGFAPAH